MTWVHNADPAVDAQSEWPTIVAVCISLTALMATTVGLRLYVRAWMIKSVGIDDYVMLFSMVSKIPRVLTSVLIFHGFIGLQHHL